MNEAVRIKSDVVKEEIKEYSVDCKFRDQCKNEMDVIQDVTDTPDYVKCENIDEQNDSLKAMSSSIVERTQKRTRFKKDEDEYPGDSENGDFQVATGVDEANSIKTIENIKFEEIDIKHQSADDVRLSSSENGETFDVKINSVDFLVSNKAITNEQRIQIKRLGRLTPDLSIAKIDVGKSRNFARKFNRSVYDKYKWLCGCPKRNKLFCFVCLLMGGDHTAWSRKGVCDLKHFNERAKKHGNCSEKHLHNALDFSVLGKTDIKRQLDSAYRENIRRHNENVDKNRHILNQLIDCINFCGAFELVLRGHDETENSNNPGVFLGLVDFISELDLVMKEHLTNANNFGGSSKTIQNELLDTMLQVCRSEIKDQVKSSPFLAIQADEITDVGNKQQLVIILRYVHDGNITERFWGYVKPDGDTAEYLADAILSELEAIGVKQEQLVAQCFDEASVMSGELGGVQTKIKQKFPQAYFVHCYAHQLELVIKKAASINKKVKIFFSNVDGFASFFSSSVQRTEVLDGIVKRHLPKATPIRWNVQCRTVCTIYENKDVLTECLETISDLANDTKTINEATGLLNYLRNEEFLFWLDIFHRIMPHVDLLCRQLQKRTATGPYIKTCLAAFEKEISKVRAGTDRVAEIVEPSLKRTKYDEGISDNHITAAKEVCDVILAELKDRFAFTDHLFLSNLLATENFKSYTVNFPENDLRTGVQCYDNVFDTVKLRTELSTLYRREDMRSMEGVSALLSFLKGNQLEETFSEMYKLCNIVATIPMITTESERCFSTLKRVKTFLRNTVSQDVSLSSTAWTALAMLSIEKKMIKQIPNFNDKVINIFVSVKDRQAEFLYK